MKVQNFNKYRRVSVTLLFLFTGLALLPVLIELQQGSSYIFSRKVIPALWCVFLVIMFFFVPRVHAAGKLIQREIIYFEAGVCAIIIISVKILTGSILGQLGGSPYDLSMTGILGNLFSVLPGLAARRQYSYILCTCVPRQNIKIYHFLLYLCCIQFELSKLLLSLDMENISVFLSTEAGPKPARNIMLSYLALYGGPLALYFMGSIQEIFHWCSPILSS